LACATKIVRTNFALEMCLAARNRQKIHKTPILAFKVVQGRRLSTTVELSWVASAS